MYHSPHTFFDDESPPTSPVQHKKNIPTFHLSPAPGFTAEQRRWNSLSRPKPHPLPFSYEYIFEEGKLAGLAEFHPDQDFLHYSSSRGSSTSNSRNPSRRTSGEQSVRSSTDTRCSHDSERSHGAPPSPRTADKIKRALSLSRTRGRRTDLDEKGRISSSTLRAQGLGVSITAASPAESKTPIQNAVSGSSFESPRAAPTPTESKRPTPASTPVPSPASVPIPFESPRAAPRPPQKQVPSPTRPVPATHQTEPKTSDPKQHGLGIITDLETKSTVVAKEKSFEGPAKRPALVNSTMQRAVTEPMMSGTLQPEKIAARPALRRKTSKFIEHLDDKPIQIEVEPEIPVIPPFDFMLPSPPAGQTQLPQPAQTQPPQTPLPRSRTTTHREKPYTHPEWPRLTTTPSPKKAEPIRTIPRFALGPRTQPLPNYILRKRSASNMTASNIEAPFESTSFHSVKASTQPAPEPTSLKRATSMRTRPTAVWTDVRMAEGRAMIVGPVVARGQGRVVRC